MQSLKPACEILVILLIPGFLMGCAMPQNMSLKRDIKTIDKIVAIAYPPREVSRAGASAAAAWLLFGPGAGLVMLSEGKKMVEAYALPDFGQSVLDNFLTRARNELPYWPEVIVEQNEEKANKLAAGQFLLEVRPKILRVHFFGVGKGLIAITTAQLKDSAGEIIWRSSFQYDSEDYGRAADIDQWEQHGGKLLKEEWTFAAEETAKKLLTGFGNSLIQ